MKLKNYLLAGTALVALSFMAACTEEDPIANGDGTETPGNNDDGRGARGDRHAGRRRVSLTTVGIRRAMRAEGKERTS